MKYSGGIIQGVQNWIFIKKLKNVQFIKRSVIVTHVYKP